MHKQGKGPREREDRELKGTSRVKGPERGKIGNRRVPAGKRDQRDDKEQKGTSTMSTWNKGH